MVYVSAIGTSEEDFGTHLVMERKTSNIPVPNGIDPMMGTILRNFISTCTFSE